MERLIIYLTSWLQRIFGCHKSISFVLQQWTNGVNPIEDLTITGTGTFRVYRGTSTTPIQTFTLNNSSIDVQLPGTDDPNVSIKGNVRRITELNIRSTFWRPYVGGLLSIDLSHAIGLKKLSLQWNSLVALDISNCKKLTSLILDNSQKLETVDLSKNKKLKEFSYSQSSMYAQQDVLKTLILDNPELTKLSLTNQHALPSLDISKCPELLMLNLLDAQLPIVDITHNTKLNQISCTFNQTDTDNFYLALLTNVQAHPRAGTLYTRPCPTGTAIDAQNTLTTTYGWTITCN
ncbi:MAG TPA: hypothetical protein VIH57_18485 [Bacteroidales bacterium]